MYPYAPPVSSSIFQYATLTSLMYGLYSGRNDDQDPSVNIKPMLLQQNEEKFLGLIGQ